MVVTHEFALDHYYRLEGNLCVKNQSREDPQAELANSTEISPWQRVLSTPFALHAANADNATVATRVQGAKALLDANGILIRKIAKPTGLGPFDTTTKDRQIASRVLAFNKIRNDTAIRISYTDNFSVSDGTVRYEIHLDGTSCPGGALVYDYANDVPVHRSHTIIGQCEGIASGEHEIQIWVSPAPGYTDNPLRQVYTGWLNSRWLIEAEEVY